MKRMNERDEGQHRPSIHRGSQVTNHDSRAMAPRARSEALSPASLERHQRCCRVCRHPDRELIEREFLHWRSPTEISNDYGINDHASITRHANATGLYERRIRSVRCALERVIEQAEEATVTGHSIVRAVRAYLCITDDNKWVQPPTVVHIVHSSAGSNSQPETSIPSVADASGASPLPQADAKAAISSSRPAVPQLTEGLAHASEANEIEGSASAARAAKETVLTIGYDPAPMVSAPFVPVYPEPGRNPGRRKG